MLPENDKSPIGVFDSGIGGLSVIRSIWQELPQEPILYLADQVHVPYGPRSLGEVRAFSEGITRFLLDQGSKLIVVACNTASAASLNYLRSIFPGTPFVGMEPAVKPAAEHTLSGVVGVLATPATFQGKLYSSVVERFANDVELIQHTCPGLVEQVEAGCLETKRTRHILEGALHYMLERDIDSIVLGCTHYPFVIPLIKEIVGPGIRVIDPAPAIARQTRGLLDQHNLRRSREETSARQKTQPKFSRFLTSGDDRQMEAQLTKLLGISQPVDQVQWQGLVLSSP